jgi:phosphatidylethanolamine-binding protein
MRLLLSATSLLLATQVTALPLGQDQNQQALLLEEPLTRPLRQNQQPLFSTVHDVLVANKVIGDVLDDFEPSQYLDISYPDSHESVLLGNDIPVDSVSSRPVFTFHAIEPATYAYPARNRAPRIRPQSSVDQKQSTTYTLILTDPDAKSRQNPKWSEMCHWILTNLTTPLSLPLPGLFNPQLLKPKAGELVEYKPPGPPPKTGPHRYVFVLLEGDTRHVEAPSERQHWGYDKPRHGVRDWAKENGLKVVGANFFFAQNEKQ